MEKLEDGIFYFTDDFDKSMMDFVEEKWGGVHNDPWLWSLKHEVIYVSTGYKPYTHTYEAGCDDTNTKKLTKQQFKEIVGMPNNKQFTKDDLKTGHLVVLRDVREFVVFKDSKSIYRNTDVLLNSKNHSAWLELNDLLSNLTSADGYSEYDIMEVYLQSHPYSFVRKFEDDKRKLLWKREEKSEKDLQIEELQTTIAKANEQINKLKEMD